MLNAFAAKRMTDNTLFSRFELMGELSIGLAKRQLKPNIAKCFDEIICRANY